MTVSAGTPVDAARRFGRELASMHSRPAEFFGADWDGYIADIPLDNTRSDKGWGSWYAERRLLPYLRTGYRHLDPAEVRLVEKIIATIDAFAGPQEPPARIHGDLWSGNLCPVGGGECVPRSQPRRC